MFKSAIFLKSLYDVSAGLLSTASIATPLSVAFIQNNASADANPKRLFNEAEESGLNYNVDGSLNPFEFEKAQETKFNIFNNFYSRGNPTSNTNYHSLEWKDLKLTSSEGLSSWLSQIVNYLSDDERYQVKITNLAPQDTIYKDNPYLFCLDNDFSSKQDAEMNVHWETSQFGFLTQSDFKEFSSSSDAVFNYIQFYHSAPHIEANETIWRSLTGSDFYTNFNEKAKDTNPKHIPHDFNFALSANKQQQEYSQHPPVKEGKQPINYSASKYSYDFSSEDASPTEGGTKFNSLSDLFNFAPTPSKSSGTKLIIPSKSTNLGWFAYDSTKTYSQGAGSYSYIQAFNDAIKQHHFENDDENIWSKLNLANTWYFKGIPDGSAGNYFFPEKKTNDDASKVSDLVQITLPTPQSQKFPVAHDEAFVNFVNYYDLKDQDGLSCEIHLNDKNVLTYTFYSGGAKVNTVYDIIDSKFKDFFNVCLSSMATRSSYQNYKEGETGKETQPDQHKSYSQLISSDDNKIIDLYSKLGSSAVLDLSAPFSQSVGDVKGGNQITAQSSGFGISPSNKSIEAINYAADDKITTLINLIFESNLIKLVSDTSGMSNKMSTNLDYLLAIDPSTTNFYDDYISELHASLPPVKIRLNPYYIQAAANAYSSYVFWLEFYKENLNKLNQVIAPDPTITKMIFRDLIMRGFIKSKTQAEIILDNLLGNGPSKTGKKLPIAPNLVPISWVTKYYQLPAATRARAPLLDSYCILANGSYQPNPEFVWEEESIPVIRNDLWVDENGKKYEQNDTVSASTWAPFCWQYGISPSTFSCLKSIPMDYTFSIPYGYLNENASVHDWNKGNVSGISEVKEKTITWSQLLDGDSVDFEWPSVLEDSGNQNWNNMSIVFGCCNSSKDTLQGIHGIPSENPKIVRNSQGADVKLSVPAFSNIKIASISSNNHIDGNQKSDFDFNAIQEFATRANRKKYIKDRNSINYLSPSATHNVLAINKNDKVIKLDKSNNLSNNTFVVTKVNAKKIEHDKLIENYIQIDTDGSLGIILNFSNWRKTISTINKNIFYSSVNNTITGTNLKNDWLMSGVAPEDWFDDSYLVTFNGYNTYKWAFHPSGLWCYNMQFYQDESKYQESSGEWDELHQTLNLDYSLWGRPIIEPITKNSYVPPEIIEDYYYDPVSKTWELDPDCWKARYQNVGHVGKNPVFYTNNATFELAFKVVYNDLKFEHPAYPGTYVTPIQYVYFPDCYYNFALNPNGDSIRSINDFTNANTQFGDFAPTVLDHYQNESELAWPIEEEGKEKLEYTKKEIEALLDEGKITQEQFNKLEIAVYSYSDVCSLLSTNEIINFYKSAYSNGLLKSNVYYTDFVNLYKNGWIYLEPVTLSNSEHRVSFRIHYTTIKVDDLFRKAKSDESKITNENWKIMKYKNQIIKIPDLTIDSWEKTSDLTITDFRAIGTEWSLVKNKSPMTPLVIGLIVCCCIVPILIVVTGIALKRIRTKYKRIK